MTPLMVSEYIKTALLGWTLLVLIGCAAAPTVRPLIVRGNSQNLRSGDIVETATNAFLSFDSLIDHLSTSPIIYVGETHTSAQDHRFQQEILKGLYARNPSLMVAMEMFPREVQPWLDRYSQGLIPEKEFLEKVDWEKNWGYSFDLYRGLMHLARARRLKIIGLNAPIEVIDKIGQNGLSSLPPAERNRLASDFHFDHPQHREYLRREFAHHPRGNIKDFDTFVEAQLGWEETMAETLARVTASFSKEQQILVFIGKGHLLHRLGVPRLTRLRNDLTFKTVIPIPLDYPIRTLSPDLADYICITESLPAHEDIFSLPFIAYSIEGCPL